MYYGLFSVWQSVFSYPYQTLVQKLLWCFFPSFCRTNFVIQFYEKMRRKTPNFDLIIWQVNVISFTQRDWYSSLIQIWGEYVTFSCPFLQYFVVNKCRMLPLLHKKGIIFHYFNLYKYMEDADYIHMHMHDTNIGLNVLESQE